MGFAIRGRRWRLIVFNVAALCAVLGIALAGPHTNRGTQPVVTHPIASSFQCRICHGFNFDKQHHIEPGDTWSGSMMANSARDPIFWAALDVANNDLPGIGDFCLRCHAPGPWLAGRSEPPGGSTDGCGLTGEIDNGSSNDFDGVTCHLCHRMMVNPAPPPGELPFYTENAQFWIDDGDCNGQGEPCRRGPYSYLPGESEPPHPYQYSPYHLQSDLCGTCHNVTNPVRNLIVNGVDQGIRFPMERTHKEWSQSEYSLPGPNEASCQECHMPESGVDQAYACAFLANDRTGNLPVHQFVGGNSWVPEVLRLAYPKLMMDFEFAMTRDAAVAKLQSSATLDVMVPPTGMAGSPLSVQAKVTNLSGHKLPTGYAEGRRMWLALEARDGNGVKFWESGAYDAASGVLTHDPALRAYEAKQGVWDFNGSGQCDTEDGGGDPIFHFVLNNCVAADTRIPPLGFTGGNDIETKPVGRVYPETSPGSGRLVNYDLVNYSIPLPPGIISPVIVSAKLRYQTTSKEYVEFLRDEAVDNGFPDDCIDRSSGPETRSRGEILYDLWALYDRAPPVDMVTDSGAAVLPGSGSPGEASGPGNPLMRVTSFDRVSRNVTLSYDAACGTTDHTIYAGSLSSVSTMTFSERVCNRGTTGSTSFTAGTGSVFWLIVGNDGVKEGSYGTNHAGAERPEDAGASPCSVPQDLSQSCDP